MTTTARPLTFDQLRRREALAKSQAAATAAPTPAVRIRKGPATFMDLVNQAEFSDWLPGALDAMAGAIHAAVYQDADMTSEQRAAALIASVDQFRDQLLERGASTILKRAKSSIFKGVLGPKPAGAVPAPRRVSKAALDRGWRARI